MGYTPTTNCLDQRRDRMHQKTTRRCERAHDRAKHPCFDRRGHHHDHHLTPSKVRQKGGSPPGGPSSPRGGWDLLSSSCGEPQPLTRPLLVLAALSKQSNSVPCCGSPPFRPGDHLFTCLMAPESRILAGGLSGLAVDVDTTTRTAHPLPTSQPAEQSRGHPSNIGRPTHAVLRPSQRSAAAARTRLLQAAGTMPGWHGLPGYACSVRFLSILKGGRSPPALDVPLRPVPPLVPFARKVVFFPDVRVESILCLFLTSFFPTVLEPLECVHVPARTAGPFR